MAVADCTGHGVPGAFMSMLGISLLNETVTKSSFDSPAEILERLRRKIKKLLHQNFNDDSAKDGMDMSVGIIDYENLEFQFAGAYNPGFIVSSDSQLVKLEADLQPVSIHLVENEFTNKHYKLAVNDCIYLFTDGYVDQIGGYLNKKFMMKNFKKLLVDFYPYPMEEQKRLLRQKFIEWKADYSQIDDILVLGIRV